MLSPSVVTTLLVHAALSPACSGWLFRQNGAVFARPPTPTPAATGAVVARQDHHFYTAEDLIDPNRLVRIGWCAEFVDSFRAGRLPGRPKTPGNRSAWRMTCAQGETNWLVMYTGFTRLRDARLSGSRTSAGNWCVRRWCFAGLAS